MLSLQSHVYVLHHVDMDEFAAFAGSEHDDGAGDLQWKGCSGRLAAMVGVGPDAAAPQLVVKKLYWWLGFGEFGVYCKNSSLAFSL